MLLTETYFPETMMLLFEKEKTSEGEGVKKEHRTGDSERKRNSSRAHPESQLC